MKPEKKASVPLYPPDKVRDRWRPKFIETERHVGYFTRNVGHPPDGSFVEAAFIAGWSAAVRAMKRKGRAGR